MGLRSLNEKCHGTWCRRAYFLPFRFRWRALLPFITGSPFPALGSHGTVSSELEKRVSVQGRWDAVAAVPVGYVARVFTGSCSVEYFGVCRVFMVFMVIRQSPWNAAEERRRGRNGGTTFRLDSLGTLVYGVNIFLLIEIFTL